MREQFPWFLDPTEDELQRLWEEATFSFDANVLLNLYRVDRETTEDYFKIFRALGDRIYLPHEAAHQFFQNRRDVIRTEQNSFHQAKKRVRDWVERRIGFDNLKQQLRGGDFGQIIEDEIESIFEDRGDYKEGVEAVKNDLIERIEDLEKQFTPTGTTRANAEDDQILGELIEIFEGKTGDELQGDMDDLKKEAQARYRKRKPPGYEDYDGGDELSRGECEDFIIWRQIMRFAEKNDEDVVFISGERKPDWWEKNDEYEIVRPRHELFREFRENTGQAFWMLTTENMVRGAEERLEVYVKEKSTDQTAKVSEVSEKNSEKGILGDIKYSRRVLTEIRGCLIAVKENTERERWSLSKNALSEAKDKYNILFSENLSDHMEQDHLSEMAYNYDVIQEGIRNKEENTVISKTKDTIDIVEKSVEYLNTYSNRHMTT